MRRALPTCGGLLVLALAVAGCGNSFDPASFVDKLRLLAVEAEPPEIPFGATSMLAATATNPGGSTPTVTWDACLLPPPPGTGETVNQDCVSLPEGDPMLIAFGSGDRVTATMPMLDLTQVGLPDQTNGVYLPVRLKLEADGNTLTAFYSLRIYVGFLLPGTPPANQNPTLTDIVTVPAEDAGASEETPLDPTTPAPVHANDEIDLRALLTGDSQETYQVYDGNPATTMPRSVTETVKVSWFATAGHFTNDVTGVDKPDTALVLDKHLPASGSTIDLWAVARDERGGSDVIHRTLLFQ
ncbi:MAG TPA: hypothetical protein VN947_13635 [Polyangia bacterium]|nr:hypothetical protein [Polyangia bacterium]